LVRDLGSFELRSVSSATGAFSPFLSPDGEWLGYFADGALRKVRIAGGDPVKLCEVPATGPGGTWESDGAIYFTPTWTDGIWRISDQGGKPEQLTVPRRDQGESGHFWPSFLPDGSAAVFTIFGEEGIRDSRVALLDLASRNIEVLTSGAGAQYVAPGQLVLFRHGAWLAVPFDPRSRRLGGPEARVLADVRPLSPLGENEHNFSFAGNGLLAFVASEGFGLMPLSRYAWIDRGGRVEPLPFEGQHKIYSSALSPDGKRVAATLLAEGELQIWLYDLERGTRDQLTRDGQNFSPSWSPDGGRLAVTSLLHGSFDIRAVRADGGAPPSVLVATDLDEDDWKWSPDGVRGVYTSIQPGTGRDVLTRSEGEAGNGRAVVASPFEDFAPQLSPDGRWLMYFSHEKLYVTGFPDAGERLQISAASRWAAWSPRRPELFTLEGEKIVSLSYEVSAGKFRPLESKLLLESPQLANVSTFEVSNDAQRFLVAIPVPGKVSATELRVLTDGFAVLRGAQESR
jgi:serine/threonine-protein kinase